MTKPLLIIRTACAESGLPGVFARRGDACNWIKTAGNFHDEAVRVVSVFAGEKLPKPDTVKAAIITGSPVMVTDRVPWSEYTAAWIREACSQSVPLLGICFGHQLIAHALGGVVGANPKAPEFGTRAVYKTLHAQNDPLFHNLPEKVAMQTAHYQSVLRLPEAARLLASNRQEKHQAYRIGECVWGVQFHPEMDAYILREILLQDRSYYEKDGIDVDEALASLSESPHGQQLFSNFKKFINKK
jgi:GMP synthase (glutamine-hydrolysing)